VEPPRWLFPRWFAAFLGGFLPPNPPPLFAAWAKKLIWGVFRFLQLGGATLLFGKLCAFLRAFCQGREGRTGVHCVVRVPPKRIFSSPGLQVGFTAIMVRALILLQLSKRSFSPTSAVDVNGGVLTPVLFFCPTLHFSPVSFFFGVSCAAYEQLFFFFL